MIYTITRLFSEKEEYINGKETKYQENSRKKLTGSLVGLGTTIGAEIGLGTAKNKNFERALKIAKNAHEDNEKVIDSLGKMVSKFKEKGSRFKDQQSKDAFEYALKLGDKRVNNNIKGINKALEVAKAMDNKATLKRGLKGAAIGTAVMAPLAYAANKSIKNQNEKINRSRRGKKRGLDQKDNHKEKKLLKEYREQLKTYSIFSRFFPKKKESLPESNLLEIIENFPKIKKDVQNLQRNQNKIKELGEKLIDLGITNGYYHPGFFKETSWIDNSGWAILIEGTDMDESLLINTKTGKLEDCMGNKFNGVPSYLKFLIKNIDTLLDPVLAKEDDYSIFDDSKKVYDDCVKVWKELKPLLK